MQVSDITAATVGEYIRSDEPLETESVFIEAIIAAAKAYASEYTGIPATSTDETVETLDAHEDITIAVLVLCQDMYDNRSMYVDKSNTNKVISTILDMHCRHLL